MRGSRPFPCDKTRGKTAAGGPFESLGSGDLNLGFRAGGLTEFPAAEAYGAREANQFRRGETDSCTGGD